MIKSELIAKLAAENPHLSRDEADRVVSRVLDAITDALADGRRVELRGFGAFSVRARPARAGRNPRTGEAVSVRGKAAPFFKSGKEMRERLNLVDEVDSGPGPAAVAANGLEPAAPRRQPAAAASGGLASAGRSDARRPGVAAPGAAWNRLRSGPT